MTNSDPVLFIGGPMNGKTVTGSPGITDIKNDSAHKFLHVPCRGDMTFYRRTIIYDHVAYVYDESIK